MRCSDAGKPCPFKDPERTRGKKLGDPFPDYRTYVDMHICNYLAQKHSTKMLQLLQSFLDTIRFFRLVLLSWATFLPSSPPCHANQLSCGIVDRPSSFLLQVGRVGCLGIDSIQEGGEASSLPPIFDPTKHEKEASNTQKNHRLNT